MKAAEFEVLDPRRRYLSTPKEHDAFANILREAGSRCSTWRSSGRGHGREPGRSGRFLDEYMAQAPFPIGARAARAREAGRH